MLLRVRKEMYFKNKWDWEQERNKYMMKYLVDHYWCLGVQKIKTNNLDMFVEQCSEPFQHPTNVCVRANKEKAGVQVRNSRYSLFIVCSYAPWRVILTIQQHVTFKPATDDSRDIRKMRKTCKKRETWEKKVRARDNVKINYTHFAIQIFSRAIILSLIAQEIPLHLVHNYRFYCEMVREVRHEKSVSWSSIKNTK